jgi:outer membrane protein TolC
MKYRAQILLFAFVASSLMAADILTLKQAAEIVLGRNPDVRSMQEQMESSEAKTRLALAPQEPSFQLTYNDTNRFLALNGAASTVYQISQPIAFPGKAFVVQASLRAQTKALYHQLRSKRLSVLNDVRSAYYNLALARKNIQLNLDQKRSYEQILQIAKRRYESGGITQVDLMYAQTSLYSNLNDLSDLQASEKSTLAQLNLLLGNETYKELEVEPLKMVEDLKPFNRDSTLQKMLDNQPEIQSALYQERAAENAHASAVMGLLPDFQVFVGTTYYNVPGATPFSATTNLNQTYMAGIQVSIPLWGLLNERESINSAAHDQAAADANLSSQFLQSKTTLEATLQQLDAFDLKLKNFQDHLLPLAEQTLSLALTNYGSGKIDFQALSLAANTWRTTKTTYYTMVVNYLTTYYSVGQLTGEDLL